MIRRHGVGRAVGETTLRASEHSTVLLRMGASHTVISWLLVQRAYHLSPNKGANMGLIIVLGMLAVAAYFAPGLVLFFVAAILVMMIWGMYA